MVNFGVGGGFLACGGLWAVPYLEEVRGQSRTLAAQHTSLLLLGVTFGSMIAGFVSDRLGSRRGVMRAYALPYALSWLPWVWHVSTASPDRGQTRTSRLSGARRSLR